jgi:DNA-binding response OmpR family regulator
MVAEDEAILAFDLVEALAQAGANVIGPVASVERAVELAHQEALDCSVLDVMLKDGLVFPPQRFCG